MKSIINFLSSKSLLTLLLWIFLGMNSKTILEFITSVDPNRLSWIWALTQAVIAWILWYLAYRFNEFQEKATIISIEWNRPVLVSEYNEWVSLKNTWDIEWYDIRVYVKTEKNDVMWMIENTIPVLHPWGIYNIKIWVPNGWFYKSVIVLYKNVISWFTYCLWFNHYGYDNKFLSIWHHYDTDDVHFESPVKTDWYFILLKHLSLENQIWKTSDAEHNTQTLKIISEL